MPASSAASSNRRDRRESMRRESTRRESIRSSISVTSPEQTRRGTLSTLKKLSWRNSRKENGPDELDSSVVLETPGDVDSSDNTDNPNPQRISSNANAPRLRRKISVSSRRDFNMSMRSIQAHVQELPIPRQPRQVRKFRNICGRIVNDERVQIFIISLIVANAIMMGVATFDFVTDDEDVNDVFEVVDLVFLIVFTVELALQFIYHLWRLFTDGWLLFDFIIIMMSWVFSDVQIIRSFRIFRALRLITKIEVMKNLVSALLSVVPKMLAITALLMLIFYIFAVMFTSMFKELYDIPDTPLEFDYFGSIWDSLFTAYQFMTLDDWNPIAREVMIEKSWAWFPFIAFIIVSGFVVINLVIAVLCDAVAALHGDPEEGDSGDFLDEVWEEDDGISNLEGIGGRELVEDNGHGIEDHHDESKRKNPSKMKRRASLDSVTMNDGKKEDDPVKNAVSKINNERIQLKRKVDVIESQINELTLLQSQTLHTLQFLRTHVREAKDR